MTDEMKEKLLLENSRRTVHDAVLRAGLTLTDDRMDKMKRFMNGEPVVLESGFGPIAVDAITQRGADDVQFPNPNIGANDR